LRPVHCQVELAASVIELTGFGGWGFSVIQQFAGGGIKRLGQNLCFVIAGFDSKLFEADR